MKIFPVSCYSNIEQYHKNEEQHIGYIAMRNLIEEFLISIIKNGKISILEFGAGTGLLTKKLICNKKINLTVNEPDLRCQNQLRKNLNIQSLSRSPIEKYYSNNKYDCIVSSFAHDHIKNSKELMESLHRNLKNSGYYVCGIELLREYINSEDREKALREWHGYVIENALYNNNKHLAYLEAEALESGINKIADFKVSQKIYEKEMKEAKFKLLTSQATSPKTTLYKGGVYFYVWQKQ